jgi:hypothetical protein
MRQEDFDALVEKNNLTLKEVRMKKQTAVEWLYSELSKNNISNDSIKSRIYKESEILKQAIAMEKEQIISANEDCSTNELGELFTGEQYYNENYGN